jgi:hypothetical protein
MEEHRELDPGDFLNLVTPFAGCFVRLSIFVSKNLLSNKLMLKIATPYIFGVLPLSFVSYAAATAATAVRGLIPIHLPSVSQSSPQKLLLY